MSKGLVALVDADDFDWLNQWKWSATLCKGGGNKHYAQRKCPKDYRPRYIKMHRLIIGAPSNMAVDHVNRDGLDNRRVNLRLCTIQQNAANRILPYRKREYCGVKTTPTAYAAVIANRHLGTFADPVSAALAYDRAARQRYGEFAVLNFPEGGE